MVSEIYLNEKIKNYVLDIVCATREPEQFDLADLKLLFAYRASPRATIYLLITAKAHAFPHDCDYITPEDIKQVVMDVLCRMIVTYGAEELTSEDVVRRILDQVEVP